MSSKITAADIAADPFKEHGSRASRERIRLLGCDFEFECDSVGLQRIVASAYANLPRHKVSAVVPRLRISLMLAPRARKQPRGEVPRIEMLSGADFLGATDQRLGLRGLLPRAADRAHRRIR